MIQHSRRKRSPRGPKEAPPDYAPEPVRPDKPKAGTLLYTVTLAGCGVTHVAELAQPGFAGREARSDTYAVRIDAGEWRVMSARAAMLLLAGQFPRALTKRELMQME